MKPYIVFGQPRLTEEEINAVSDTLRSGWIGTGPKAKQFETEFAAYQGAKLGAAVSSCTAALTLSLRANGVGKGDEVITTALTFAATVNAIIHTGAKPVIVDVAKDSFNLDLDQVEKKITKKTKAVIPVHFAGAPVDMDRLHQIRDRHGVKIIHDCAHAIETEWNGRRLSSFGDTTCFSFYSTKNITTIEGGMVCSDDAEFIEKVRLLSYQGMSKDAWKRYSNHGYNHYDIITQGFKLNFTDVQASIGLSQLKSLEERYLKRARNWDRFQEAFAGFPFEMPRDLPAPHRHARHLYTILIDAAKCGMTRDEFMSEMHAQGIGTGAHYRSIPSMSFYRESYKWDPSDFPRAYRIGEQTVSLPMTPYLTQAEVQRIIDTVGEVLRDKAAVRQVA